MGRKRHFIACTLAVLVSISPAQGADGAASRDMDEAVLNEMVGTFDVSFEDTSTGGHLMACSLVFNALARDYAYKKGRPFYLGGSLGMSEIGGGGRLGMFLKVMVNDIVERGPPIKLDSAAPAFVYLASEDLVNNAKSFVSSNISDNGALISIFIIDRAANSIVRQILEKNVVTIAFSRIKGGIDVKVPLDLTVIASAVNPKTNKLERVHDAAEVQKFARCQSGLIDQNQASQTEPRK